MRHQAEVERNALRSAAALFKERAQAEKRLDAFDALLEQKAGALYAEVKAYYLLQSELVGTEAAEPPLTQDEKLASSLFVERTGPAGMGGFGRGQGGMRKIPPHMSGEFNVLLGQKRTALEIRDFLSGEFEPVPVSDVLDDLRALEKAGSVKLVQK